MVITDGAPGLPKAVARCWPDTRIQRCTFHVHKLITKQTTMRPRLPAGRELYALSVRLLRVSSIPQAREWIQDYQHWCLRWEDFLKQRHTDEHGRWRYTHERLRTARAQVNRILGQGVLFTYLDPQLATYEGVVSMNNQIEGGVNARLRAMLREHRGMSLERRIKAIFWWCYRHSPSPQDAAWIVRVMPTDQQIANHYHNIDPLQRRSSSIPLWGDSVVWEELHHSTPYPQPWI